MTSPSIRVDSVNLEYPLGSFLKGSLKSQLFSLVGFREKTPRYGHVSVLQGVSFKIQQGERVGIIGRNGAGKSTLLRAMAGIYPPSAGSIAVNGRIQSMFDIGLGFEVESTGRENILYRGLVMGIPPARIRAREQEIIDFAELGAFIDLPVRTYSAGMFVRLAFAISSYLEGDILLIDEVFGAGDAAFASKAVARMHEIVDGAGIVVFVSHGVHTVAEICSRVLWLEGGRIKMDGPSKEVVDAYLQSVA